MARLEDSGNNGLPKPPAPPRRGANPWTLSATARKPGPQSQPMTRELLEELISQAPVHETSANEAPAHEEARPPAAASRRRPGFLFLVIAGVLIVIAIRVFFEARAKGDWTKLIGPLVLIAFIAHGWWRARQRREANKSRAG
ncbi:MAG: hypothetical protein OEW16_10090 [Gammaproteobacteria bacterium]|nr:hypothetical protein [Gammaproteobacteria bacterium]